MLHEKERAVTALAEKPEKYETNPEETDDRWFDVAFGPIRPIADPSLYEEIAEEDWAFTPEEIAALSAP